MRRGGTGCRSTSSTASRDPLSRPTSCGSPPPPPAAPPRRGPPAAAHVGLLRVWGGGLIESDSFYDACDRLGIMVWQELSMSSSGVESVPSADPAFVALMASEARDIAPRVAVHPSLVLWCGGNELADEEGPLDERSPVLAA